MRSGDKCPRCGKGHMKRYATKTERGRRTQYLRCTQCTRTGKDVFLVDELGRNLVIRPGNKVIECPSCGVTITDKGCLNHPGGR